jgi:glycosyltransferase involved in cell wall biosynthesis
MKIAYDHQIFGWQKYGGVSRYFFELANHLATSLGQEVAVISPLYVNSYLSSSATELKVLGKRMPAVKRSGRIYRAINQIMVPSLMRGFKPDIVHETYYSPKRLAPQNCKVVLSVFDMIHELFPESFSKWDPLTAEKKVAVARADHLICNSENTRQDLIRLLDIDPEKTSVVHLGFSLTKMSNTTISKLGRPYILHVGGRAGYKNFEALLKAYASKPTLMRDFDLVAFGAGGFTARERALLGELGIDNGRVKQIGGDDSVLAHLYKGAALFVYPSCYEGFGIPPLEAMSFDCPVACSNRSSIPEVVGDAAALFDPDSVDSIATVIESTLSDARLMQNLVARGRERIKLFSWNRCAEQTWDIYRRLLA